MIFNRLLELYLCFYISAVAHEFGHLIAAKIINLNVSELHIGDRLLAIRFGRFSISPWFGFGGYVSFPKKEMLRKTKKQIALFFFSGSAVNLLLIIIGFLFIRFWAIYGTAMILINAMLLLENMIPFFHMGNDIRKFFRYIKAI